MTSVIPRHSAERRRNVYFRERIHAKKIFFSVKYTIRFPFSLYLPTIGLTVTEEAAGERCNQEIAS